MAGFLRLLLHALAGLVGAYLLTVVLGVLFLLPAGGGGDAGGTAMGIFFGLGPMGGALGAIAGLLFGLSRRRKSNVPPAP